MAPARTTRSALRMADEMVGASIEVNGGKVYDPLGLLQIHEINPGVLPHPKWLREAELKHCRICMLASIGAFTGQWGEGGLTIPGYTAVADPVQNLNQFVTAFPGGFAQIILAIGIIEGNFFSGDFWFGKGDREAGDYGLDWTGKDKCKSRTWIAPLKPYISISMSPPLTLYLIASFLYIYTPPPPRHGQEGHPCAEGTAAAAGAQERPSGHDRHGCIHL
jgi:hypothetical protein